MFKRLFHGSPESKSSPLPARPSPAAAAAAPLPPAMPPQVNLDNMLRTQLQGRWSTVFKDLGRLAPRCAVGRDDSPRETSGPAATQLLLCDLTRLLEPARFLIVSGALATFFAGKSAVEEDDVERVLHDIVGLASPVARTLKMVTQSAVMEAMYQLRIALPQMTTLRDLRGERRGWTIAITVDSDREAIVITHHRTEIGGAPAAGDSGYFELRWSLCVLLDMQAATVREAILKVEAATPGPHMDASEASLLLAQFPPGRERYLAI